jgi:nitroreductase
MSAPRVTEHDIHALFTERWSPRAFTGEPIEERTLLSFFEAARWAPSAFNIQPWRFLYARRGTPAWTPIFETLAEFNRGWAENASALAVVLSRNVWLPPGKTETQPAGSHAFDTGAAWMSLALQVTQSGWHAHGIAGFDKEHLRRNLEVPADFDLQAVVAIGRKGDKASLPEALQAREVPSPRRPLSETVAEGRFTEALAGHNR